MNKSVFLLTPGGSWVIIHSSIDNQRETKNMSDLKVGDKVWVVSQVMYGRHFVKGKAELIRPIPVTAWEDGSCIWEVRFVVSGRVERSRIDSVIQKNKKKTEAYVKRLNSAEED